MTDSLFVKDKNGVPLCIASVILALIIAAGLYIRFLYLQGHYFISFDGCVFSAVGRYLISGNGISANGETQPLILPLMPLLIVDSINELRIACDKYDIGWIITDKRLVPRFSPSHAPLLITTNAPEWLKVVVKLPSGPTIILYQVVR